MDMDINIDVNISISVLISKSISILICGSLCFSCRVNYIPMFSLSFPTAVLASRMAVFSQISHSVLFVL